MTTIAYKDGELAYDSLVSKGNARLGNMQKGVKSENFIAAVCGAAMAVPAFLKWVKADFNPRKKPNIVIKTEDDEFEAIVVDRKGNIIYYNERLEALPIQARYHAIGSGEDFAKGAMEVGADAKRAVQAAAKLDTGTGGRIRVLTFNE